MNCDVSRACTRINVNLALNSEHPRLSIIDETPNLVCALSTIAVSIMVGPCPKILGETDQVRHKNFAIKL